MSIDEYNKKRNFQSTSEPEGKAGKAEDRLRFVIQRHAATRLHYDFRLEFDGTLKSWAVPKGPSLNPEDKRLAIHVEDHPVSYRTFEGRIPEGNYGAGQVEIWDEGFYEPEEGDDSLSHDEQMQQQYQNKSLKFTLAGTKLRGSFSLVKMKGSNNKKAWLLIKHTDEYAVDEYDAEEQTDPDSAVNAYLQEKKEKKSPDRNG